jgi:predicted Rossmann fold flavoprotein
MFAAITCAETAPGTEVTVLEKGPQLLSKVRISGGGRCNVTHACFDAREFATHYPRGGQSLIGPFQRFQAKDTVAWFESRGVKLKTESDGRMFPVTDSSKTVIECLLRAALAAGVKIVPACGLEQASRRAGGGFELTLTGGQESVCDRLLLATGGCRAAAMGRFAVSFGHTLEPPVPSLFTFHLESSELGKLAGVSVETVEAAVPETRLRERGSLLVTHWGVSGPVILRLSAWGARELHGLDYRFPLQINWLPHLDAESIARQLELRCREHASRLVINVPMAPVPARLWEHLVLASRVSRDARWAALSRAARHSLTQQLTRTELAVTGKSLNKDEFVTCGGVRLGEVNFKTMESKLCPGLYLAGELLDIDGITGGFNFQAAWTTGWIAGKAMAA